MQTSEWTEDPIPTDQSWEEPVEGEVFDVVVIYKKGVHPNGATKETFKNVTTLEIKDNCVVLNGSNIISLSAVVSIRKVAPSGG